MLEPDTDLYVSQSDIKDYFYRCGVPAGLSRLFCLPSVPTRWLREWGVKSVDSASPEEGALCYPSLLVAPMGWSWACYFAQKFQKVHVHQIQTCFSLSSDRVLVDRSPPPTFELLELPCDNLNILGGDPVEVAKARPQVTAHLDELGFRSHEETDAEHYAISLGFAIDGLLGRVTMTPKRRARLEHALRFVERRPRLRGDELEHLVGHITFPLLVFRPLLSALNATYHFIRQHYRVRVLDSVAHELSIIRRLLPFVQSNLRLPWDTRVYATDASTTGWGFCTKGALSGGGRRDWEVGREVEVPFRRGDQERA